MLFMFFQFIICLRIKFLLSVETFNILKFDLASSLSWLSTKRIFQNDDCHKISKTEHESIVLLSKHEKGYKNSYLLSRKFLLKNANNFQFKM